MTELPKAPFGTTGVLVARLGFEALELRAADGASFDRAAAKSLLHDVLDVGISFIDTSRRTSGPPPRGRCRPTSTKRPNAACAPPPDRPVGAVAAGTSRRRGWGGPPQPDPRRGGTMRRLTRAP